VVRLLRGGSSKLCSVKCEDRLQGPPIRIIISSMGSSGQGRAADHLRLLPKIKRAAATLLPPCLHSVQKDISTFTLTVATGIRSIIRRQWINHETFAVFNTG
jgi:NAD(P)H-dependent FMN reductase